MFDLTNASWPHRARRSLTRAWPLLALLALTALCLSPSIGTGYWAEDIYYSAMIPSWPILNHTSWFAETMLQIKHSVLVGRFYPITPIITAVAFILFQQVAIYKTYIITITLLDLVLFHALIRRMSGRKGFAVFATACTVVLFQFRLTVDPILGYYAQIQWVTAAFFVSLICLHRALLERSTKFLIFSALAYFVCTLTYEMTYALVIIPLFLIAQRRPGWRRSVWLAIPFLAAAGFSAGMTMLVRRSFPSDNYVHNTDFGLSGVCHSLGYQLSAGLPLSYYWADPLQLFSKGRGLSDWFDWVLQPNVILVAVAGLAWFYQVLRRSRRLSAEGMEVTGEGMLVGLGFGLAVAPAILISISPFHRSYISLGVGWIGVMVQYYGVGLLIALGSWRLLAWRFRGGSFGRWKSLTVAMTLSMILAVTFRANIEVATAINAPPGSDRYRQIAANHGSAWHWHRLNMIAAIDAGVLGQVPAGSRVVLANQYPYWHDSLYGQFFYTKQTGKRIETLPSVLPTQLAADAPTFRVRDMIRDHKVGLVIVTSMGSPQDRVDAGRIFVKHPSIRPNASELPLIFLVNRGPGAAADSVQVFRIGKDLPTLRLGSGWGLFALNSAQAVDADRLKLVDDPVQMASWMELIAPYQTATHTSPGSTRR